jgi:hypothetical protein
VEKAEKIVGRDDHKLAPRNLSSGLRIQHDATPLTKPTMPPIPADQHERPERSAHAT